MDDGALRSLLDLVLAEMGSIGGFRQSRLKQ